MGGEGEGSGPSGVRGGGGPEYAMDPRGAPMHHHNAAYGGHMDGGAPMKMMYYTSAAPMQQQRPMQHGTLAYHVGVGQL